MWGKKNLTVTGSQARPDAGIHTRPVQEPSQLDAHKNPQASSPFIVAAIPPGSERTNRAASSSLLRAALKWRKPTHERPLSPSGQQEPPHVPTGLSQKQGH